MLELLFDRAPVWVIGPGLFILLCIAAEAGFRLQRWLDRRSPAATTRDGGAGQISGVSLGLMSLLLSFTFFIAIDHHDARRALVLEEEANAIGTAYQRVNMLAEPQRTALIGALRDYTQVRIAFYEAGENEAKLADVEHRTGILQNQVWAATGQAVRTLPNTDLSAALMEAMNHMFHQTPASKIALEAHIPIPVLFGLTVLLLASAIILGAFFGKNSRRHPLVALMLLAVLSSTMTLIIDIDRPRQHHVLINQGPLLDLRAELLSTSAEP